MKIAITKQEALDAYEGNASALARDLEISPQAIYQWDDGAIPEVQALKLRFVLKPDVFGDANPRAKKPKAAA